MAPRAGVQLATMLCVGDLERSLAFYLTLGFSLVDSEDDIALLTIGGAGWLYLFLESPPTPDKPALHLAPPGPDAHPSVILVLRVADARASYDEFRRRGVEFLTPPQSPPWGGWRCFARDPDGFVIEVNGRFGAVQQIWLRRPVSMSYRNPPTRRRVR